MMSRLLCFLLAVSFCFPFNLFAQTDCGWNPDYDGDNEIGVVDLLGILGVFEEQDSDNDGIWDSQDDCIGVEDPCGVCNGTGTDDDADGLCDDIDDCVGDYDECGVCNGTGPDFPVIEDIVVFYDSAYIEAIDLWFVYEVGADTTFVFVCPTPGCTDLDADNFNPEAVIEDGSCIYGSEECGGVSTVDYDGHTYDLVAIGDQCWFAENLRTEHYANGDAIPGNLSDSEWTSMTSGAQAVYGEGSGYCLGNCDEVANLATYGRLYNWFAVDDVRGLCPSGWHIPNDSEWWEMTTFLGNWDLVGFALKSSPLDSPAWDGSNDSGFSALPGGWRGANVGGFEFEGNQGNWWCASSSETPEVWSRRLSSGSETLWRNDYSIALRLGFSVRCVRD